MATGTVKWFNDAKGYGFITPDGGGDDLFVHHTGIAGSGYKSLAEGAKVEFESTQGPKGPRATTVVTKWRPDSGSGARRAERRFDLFQSGRILDRRGHRILLAGGDPADRRAQDLAGARLRQPVDDDRAPEVREGS